MTVALHYKRLVRNKPNGPRARMRSIEWCIHVLPFFVLLFSRFTSPPNCASHVKCQYTTTHLGKATPPDGHRFRTSSALQQTRERAYTDTSSLPRLPTRPRIKKKAASFSSMRTTFSGCVRVLPNVARLLVRFLMGPN